jgi:mono/diheme cytochrome c family protein
MRTRTVLTAFAVVIVCAGCGSSGSSPRAADGASLFTEDCAMCHSLTGRQSPRLQGGDLLALHTTQADMLEFVREMPVRHPLSATQIGAVADYVRAVEARGH